MARVLCIGGCHWDVRLIPLQPFISGESIPVTSKHKPGGSASNVARALREQGHQVDVASIVGHDPPEVCPHSIQLMERDSGRYFSVEHGDGSLAYGLADLELYEAMTPQWYSQLSSVSEDYDAVIIDSNASSQSLDALITSKPLYAVCASPPKAKNFVTVLERLEALFLNQAESEQLGPSLSNVARAVRTLGPEGLEFLERGAVVSHYPAPKTRPKQVNGLGDRLAGLSIHYLLEERPWNEALYFAIEHLLDNWE